MDPDNVACSAEVEMRLILVLSLCASLTACDTPATPSEPAAFYAFELGMPLYLWNDTQRQYEIHLMDPTTGEDVPGYAPLVVSENTEFTGSNLLSASGQQLAVVGANGEYCYPIGGGTACMGRADMLHIIDRRTWHHVIASLPHKGWAGPMAFSPNEGNLVLIFNEEKASTVMLFDTSTGNVIAQQAISFYPSALGYTDNGMTIVIYGQPPGSNPGVSKPDSPRVLLLNAATLEVKCEQKLPMIVSGYWCIEKCDASHGEQIFANWTPAVVLSSNRLYIVHANEQQLTTVDFTDRAVHTIGIQETKSLFDKLLALTAGTAKAKGSSNEVFKAGELSPDGTRLYVVGQTINSALTTEGELQEMKLSLGVEVIQVDTGQRLMYADGEAMWIKITPDGKHLLLGSWGQGGINVLDAASLESVAELAQWDSMTVFGVNGQPMILASQSNHSLTRLAILDPKTFNASRSWALKTSYAIWVSTP
jgi:hypothetical protein